MKPGRHLLFIYDPVLREFYYKDFIVEFRKSEIKLEKKRGDDIIGKLNDQLFNQNDFIFKNWLLDTPENLKNVSQTDLTMSGLFTS